MILDIRLCGAGFPSIFMPIGASARGGLVFGAYPHPPPCVSHAPIHRGGRPRIYTHTQRSAAEQQPTKLTAHGRQSLDAPMLCGVSACGWCNIGATSALICAMCCAAFAQRRPRRPCRCPPEPRARGRVSRARIMHTVACQAIRLDTLETAKNCSICYT